MKQLELPIESIAQLCAKHNVVRLFLFGSALKESFSNESDIDLLVGFKEVPLSDYADNYFDLKEELELVFNRRVDLLEESALHNPHLKSQINSEMQLIYG